jgi:hypothetical protein
MPHPTMPSIRPLNPGESAVWYPFCQITYTRDAWVKLLDTPNDYAADEAKLLCQESPDTWVAWIPNHGEVVLDKRNFYAG